MTFTGIQVQEGSGADPTAATDRIDSKDYQRIKLVKGTEGSTTAIDESSPLDAQMWCYYNFGEEENGFTHMPVTGTNGVNIALKTALYGIEDTSGAPVAIATKATAPSGGEYGFITRNIPSGTQTVAGAINIKDSTGNDILSVPDQIFSTGAQSPIAMGYDYTNAQYGPLPLGSNGDTVSCTLQYANTSIGTTPVADSVLDTITSSSDSVITGNIDGYAGVSVIVWGTHAGINLTPQISADGVNWDTCTMTRNATNAVNQATGVITTNATRGWYVTTGGVRFFRLLATAYTSGPLNVRLTPTVTGLTQVVTVIPSGTQTVSGTVTANNTLTTSSGATTNYTNLDLNTTGVNIKASKTHITELYTYNNTGATIYVKLYNKASAPTSVDTPARVFGVKAGEGTPLINGSGMQCALGFGLRCVTGVADGDITSPAANGCVITASYV